MEAVKEGEDRGFSHSDEEEGDPSSDEEAITRESDTVEGRDRPGDDASTEEYGLDAPARGSGHDHDGEEEAKIVRLSSVNEPLEENGRSNTGSGVPSVARNTSVETGLRNLKILEGGGPEKGERTRCTMYGL